MGHFSSPVHTLKPDKSHHRFAGSMQRCVIPEVAGACTFSFQRTDNMAGNIGSCGCAKYQREYHNTHAPCLRQQTEILDPAIQRGHHFSDHRIPRFSKINLVSADSNRHTRPGTLKQLYNIGIAHTNTAMRKRQAHRLGIRGAMYVYKTAEGINTRTTVSPRFQATEPQDAAQDPVTTGVAGCKLRAVYLAGGTTATENGIGRESGTNHGAHIVLTSRC